MTIPCSTFVQAAAAPASIEAPALVLTADVDGASTIAGPRGERMPSEHQLGMARLRGRHVTRSATKLFD